MKKLIIATTALALSACGGTTDDAAGGEAIAGAGDVEMEAGLWRSTVAIEEFEMQDAPPEAAAAFDSMIGRDRTSETCRTAKELRESLDEFAKGPMSSQDCETRDISVADGTINGSVTCKTDGGGAAEIVLEGTHDSTSMNMTMTANISDSQMPGGKARMVMKVSGQRIGDCS